MNTTELIGNWEVQKGKLKQKFAILTDNDLLFVEGKKEMLGRLQAKLGKTKEELHDIISGVVIETKKTYKNEKTTSILYLSLLLITGSLFAGCMSSDQKEDAANAKVEAARENLNVQQENADTVALKAAIADDLKTFKLESELKIKKNEVTIAELKLKMNSAGYSQDQVYSKKIDSLEIKNKNLKTRMGNYELTHSDWTKFKADFNRDLNEVANRLKVLVR